MSKALAVFHGRFGRATVYQLNRPFNVHAHREGHLIFHVGGTPARIDVCDERWLLTEDFIVAINPVGTAQFPADRHGKWRDLLRAVRQRRMVCPRRGADPKLALRRHPFQTHRALDKHIRRTAALVCGAPSLSSLDCELRQLIDGCYDESWQPSETAQQTRAAAAITDFRVRKSIKLMSESPGAELELDLIARDSGLSRPHFYRLFRTQTGVTPHLYLNTLMMEQALDALVATEVADRRHRLRSRLLLAKRLHPLLRRQCRHGADRIPPCRQGVTALSRRPCEKDTDDQVLPLRHR